CRSDVVACSVSHEAGLRRSPSQLEPARRLHLCRAISQFYPKYPFYERKRTRCTSGSPRPVRSQSIRAFLCNGLLFFRRDKDRSSEAKCQRRQRQSLDLNCPEIASVGWMSGRKRAGTDDFPRAQRLGWEPPHDGCAEFRQAQGGAFQRVPAGFFFPKLSVLECSMESEGGNEIAGLKLPSRKGTIDDFESHRQPIREGERSGGGIDALSALSNDRLFQTENDLGLNLQRTGMCDGQRGGVAVTVMHRIVVHVG